MKKKIKNNLTKVCIISDSFVPKKISAAGMLYNLSHEFIKNDIEVVCFFGSSKEDYSTIGNLNIEQYDLRRIRAISSSFMCHLRDGSYYSRFLYEIILSLCLCFLIIRNRQSLYGTKLVIWYSPSSFLWLPAFILKKITKAPLYMILRDIFPDWLINIGIIKNILLIKFLKLITSPQFFVPNFIGCESKKDTAFVKDKVKTKTKVIETLYNWPSLNDKLVKKNHINKIKYINFYKSNKSSRNIFGVYTGNDSISHDLNSGLEFLRLFFINSEINIQLWINQFASKLKLRNIPTNLIVKKWNMVPDYFLPHVYKYADFGIVSLNVEHKTDNLPGKFISYIQFGLPVLCFASSKSELAKMIISADCGCVIDISGEDKYNYEMFLSFLSSFNKNKKKYSTNSLKLFNNYFSLDTVVNDLTNKSY